MGLKGGSGSESEDTKALWTSLGIGDSIRGESSRKAETQDKAANHSERHREQESEQLRSANDPRILTAVSLQVS